MIAVLTIDLVGAGVDAMVGMASSGNVSFINVLVVSFFLRRYPRHLSLFVLMYLFAYNSS